MAIPGQRMASGADEQPMSDLNTTPLIDVMLVLLIMFIITIPIQSHKVALDLPSGEPPLTDLEPLRNALLLDADGNAYWNAKAVTDDELRLLLELTPQVAPNSELHFRPDAEARYERVDEVMVMIRRAGVDKLGFVGNEAYAQSF